jgi:DnaK suppressor protein
MRVVPRSDPALALAVALERLRADAADLTMQLAAIAESTALAPDDEHDAEGPTIGYERARLRALLDRAETEASDVELARARLEAGRYGICEACGRPIPPERLEALPATTRCIACAGRRDSA